MTVQLLSESAHRTAARTSEPPGESSRSGSPSGDLASFDFGTELLPSRVRQIKEGVLRDIGSELGRIAKNPLTYLFVLCAAGSLLLKPRFSREAFEAETKGVEGPWYLKVKELSAAFERDHPKLAEVVQSLADEAAFVDGGQLRAWSKPPLVNAALTGGYLLQFGMGALAIGRGIELALNHHQRKQRRSDGVQPLWESESPELVVIGPSDTSSALSIAVVNGKSPWLRPSVIVHVEEETPLAFKEEQVKYHFKLCEASNLIDISKDAGLRRADTIVGLGFDENNALFYPKGKHHHFGPEHFAGLLHEISKWGEKDLSGKKIVLIVGRGLEALGETENIDEVYRSYRSVLSSKGASLTVIHPEDILIEKIREDLARIRPPVGEPLRVALIGGEDTPMLERFKQSLEAEFGGRSISVAIVSDELVGDQKRAELEKVRRKAKADEILQRADRIYAYADSDDQSALLAQATLRSHQIDCGKIVCIAELPRAAQRAIDRGFSTICLNTELAVRIQAIRGRSKSA